MKSMIIFFESGQPSEFGNVEKFEIDANGRMTIIHSEGGRKHQVIFYM